MAKVFKVIWLCVCLGHGTISLAQEELVIDDDRLLIHEIYISGNKVTQDYIILRELLFQQGDTVKKIELLPALQRSRENLLNLAIFNFVRFSIDHLDGFRIRVNIDITERWYIWPVPILEYADRNFSTFIQNRDWDKINYGLWLKWNNFRGRNELLAGKIRLGYIKEFALAYTKPNMGKRQRHGFSTGFNINNQNEVYVATKFNQPEEYKPLERPAQTRYNYFARYNYRRKYYTTHSLRFEYLSYQVSDSVALVNPNYLGEAQDQLNYFMFTYMFNYDMRDSKVYPLEGFNIRLKVQQIGLGIIPDFAYPTLRLTGILMYHQQVAKRLYFHNVSKARYSSEKYMPHILNRGLGYQEYLSSYEPYVIDGSDYVITKYNLKLQAIRPRTFTIPYIGMEQFNKIHYALYINFFADAGYVRNDFPDPTNTMVNTLQFSSGVGIDLVTYYDQVFRIEYSINRYGEHGFFFHVETPFLRW